MKQSKENISFFKVFFKLFPIVYRVSPVLFIVCTVLSIMHGISVAVLTPLNQILFDQATLLGSNEGSVQAVLIALFIMALGHIIMQVLNGVANFLPMVYGKMSQKELHTTLQKKLAKIDPECFENTEDMDNINKAIEGSEKALAVVFAPFAIVTLYIPYLLFMAWYLYSIKPILILALVLVFIPTLLTQIVRVKVFAKVEDKAAPLRRENVHYEECIVSREYFKETRLLGGYTYFLRLFMDTLKQINKIRFRAEIKTNVIELGVQLVGLMGYAGIIWMLFSGLMQGEITVGMFAAVYGSIEMLFGIMRELICMHIAGLTKELGAAYNFIKFLDYPEATGEVVTLDRKAPIVVDNVSYKYNGTKEYALKDITFTLNAGETLAIVGENGCGKSTLVKLLTGIYKPISGDVKIGEHSTKDVAINSLYKGLSGVFQQYQKYKMLLKDNIVISEMGIQLKDGHVDVACEVAGVNPDNSELFDKGYNTMLSREFDGTDLSGGWWQKVAIARGYYKDHEMIVLDEPTAAIDPIEETKLYNRFAHISKDKTTIIVTHRLGSVKLADRILMLDKGELVEMGTHEELMRNGGKYAMMYNSQKEWYE